MRTVSEAQAQCCACGLPMVREVTLWPFSMDNAVLLSTNLPQAIWICRIEPTVSAHMYWIERMGRQLGVEDWFELTSNPSGVILWPRTYRLDLKICELSKFHGSFCCDNEGDRCWGRSMLMKRKKSPMVHSTKSDKQIEGRKSRLLVEQTERLEGSFLIFPILLYCNMVVLAIVAVQVRWNMAPETVKARINVKPRAPYVIFKP